MYCDFLSQQLLPPLFPIITNVLQHLFSLLVSAVRITISAVKVFLKVKSATLRSIKIFTDVNKAGLFLVSFLLKVSVYFIDRGQHKQDVVLLSCIL